MSQETPLINGHYYHIYNRGNNGENLFFEERNYDYFLKLYIRLLVRINPKLNLLGFQNLEGLNYSQYFSNLFNAYTKSINKNYHRTGSLFEKNFKRILIDDDSYLVQLVCYIHRNPQKHGFTKDFRTYVYSSYQTISQQKQSRIESQQVLEWFGSLQSFENYHLQFEDNP